MDTIGIVTEETVDLPPEMLEKHGILTVPAVLNWPELALMPGDNTFQKMRELGKRGIDSFGKTAQPTPRIFWINLRFVSKALNTLFASRLHPSFQAAIIPPFWR